MPRYVNPHNHDIHLTDANGRQVIITAGEEMTLPEFFERYAAKGFIRRIAAAVAEPTKIVGRRPVKINNRTPRTHTPVQVPAIARPAPTKKQVLRPPQSTPTPQQIAEAAKRASEVRRKSPPPAQSPPPPPQEQPKPKRQQEVRRQDIKPPRRIVGRPAAGDSGVIFRDNVNQFRYPLSNNIGVGILSYNRPQALKRLVDSICRHTDLRRTTVFISDDGSTDPALLEYLNSLARSGDFVVLMNQERIGIAGNSNRLLRCMARFKHGMLLNDDVEIKSVGWDIFYPTAAEKSGLHHFCMRQPGVFGAKDANQQMSVRGTSVHLVTDKPHGAVLYFSNEMLRRVGYFDEERFGFYGMEHVDWSRRAQVLHPIHGYLDVVGSTDLFVIHPEHSACPERQEELRDGKAAFEQCPANRGFISPGVKSEVPTIACVVPCKDLGRGSCIPTVIANVRAQRFPVIDIIVAEHETISRLDESIMPATHIIVNEGSDGPFNKAKVFNAGVAAVTAPSLVLHDADMVVPGHYFAALWNCLQEHESCHLGRTVLYLTQDSTNKAVSTGIIDEQLQCERTVGYFEGGSLGCHRDTYWSVGGFNEEFIGYGVEDCEFYARLSQGSKWAEERTFNFVHLWHGRTPGWDKHHDRNREIGRLLDTMKMPDRIERQRRLLRKAGYSKILTEALGG